VTLTPHAEALKELDGCRVLNVTDRAHALHPNLLEEVRKQAADGGCGIAVSTVRWSQGKANFSVSWVVGQDTKGTVADHVATCFPFNRELVPCTWGSGLDRLERSDECRRLLRAIWNVPGLIAGCCWIRPVRDEGFKICRLKGAEQELLGFKHKGH